MNIKNVSKYANLLDWTLGTACLAYGLYSGNLWWVAGGSLGLAIAAVNPVKRLSGKLQPKR
jgi:hypothetical protein